MISETISAFVHATLNVGETQNPLRKGRRLIDLSTYDSFASREWRSGNENCARRISRKLRQELEWIGNVVNADPTIDQIKFG
jgi:hypothetical protein